MHAALSRVHIAHAGRLGSGPALGPNTLFHRLRVARSAMEN